MVSVANVSVLRSTFSIDLKFYNQVEFDKIHMSYYILTVLEFVG
jgi:hypothetical protein